MDKLVSMDILMPEMSGKEAVSRIRDLGESRAVLSSGWGLFSTAALSSKLEVQESWQSPVECT